MPRKNALRRAGRAIAVRCRRAGWQLLTPFFFAWFPLLFLYEQNRVRTYAGELRTPLLLVSLITAALLAAGLRCRRDHRQATLLTACGWLVFFNYTRLYVHINAAVLPASWPDLSHMIFLPAYLLYAGIALWLLARLRAARPALATFALAAGLCLVLMSLLTIATRRPPAVDAPPLLATPRLSAAHGTPDIFLLVLDAYGRADVLARDYQHDNTGFLAALRQRGFTVFDRARTNYCATENALMAMLNLSYLPVATADTPVTPANWLADNAVLRALQPLGYRSIALPGEAPWLELRTADEHPSGDFLSLTMFHNAIINLTPLLLVENRLPVTPATLHARHVRHTLAHFPGAAGQTTPALVYAHLLMPHPPFVFTASGDPRPVPGEFSFADGNIAAGDRDAYISGYRGQVQWLNGELLAMVDRILRPRGGNAIIILTADHGPRSRYSHTGLAGTDVRECFPIFCSVYLPPAWRAAWPDPMSSVNLFRAVFNSAFQAGLPLLPDRHYYAPSDNRLLFTEVPAAEIEAPSALH